MLVGRSGGNGVGTSVLFNINILSTFIFVWCVIWVVICGARWVSAGV